MLQSHDTDRPSDAAGSEVDAAGSRRRREAERAAIEPSAAPDPSAAPNPDDPNPPAPPATRPARESGAGFGSFG